MKRNRKIGRSMMITGSVLTIIGLVITLVKRDPIVLLMSVPVLLVAVIISHNLGKDPWVGN